MNLKMVKNVINLIFKKDIHQLTKCGYEDAIEVLNSLQSNASYLKIQAAQGPTHSSTNNILDSVKKYLLRSDLSLEKLDQLSVIHVAGTKGKGSTCAYCESILRAHGYKTGFFSSPHLIEVRERIRINGKPLEKDVFAKYFWPIYNKLQAKKENSTDMPLYFRFLTIMAFHVFLNEKVDVAIIEVGIGGEYDCTNILRSVQVAGITSLGIDHVSILGKTLEEIAWQKSGIMKRGAKVFTVPQQKHAMSVLQERSIEKNCTLAVVPPFDSYIWNEHFSLNDAQKTNIALAIQLSHCWLQLRDSRRKIPETCRNKLTIISNETENGIKNCSWPGRLQILQRDNFRFFLDGAHTVESITNCIDWYAEKTKDSKSSKVLLFYTTGDRSYESLIKIAQKCNYRYVYFVPALSTVNTKPDTKYNISSNEFFKKCEVLRENWVKQREGHESFTEKTQTFLSANDALKSLPSEKYLDILVTGSLHLVGAVLNIVDPSLKNANTLTPVI